MNASEKARHEGDEKEMKNEANFGKFRTERGISVF